MRESVRAKEREREREKEREREREREREKQKERKRKRERERPQHYTIMITIFKQSIFLTTKSLSTYNIVHYRSFGTS